MLQREYSCTCEVLAHGPFSKYCCRHDIICTSGIGRYYSTSHLSHFTENVNDSVGVFSNQMFPEVHMTLPGKKENVSQHEIIRLKRWCCNREPWEWRVADVADQEDAVIRLQDIKLLNVKRIIIIKVCQD